MAGETDDIDTNDRHNVELISYVETVGSATDVAVAGDYAYVADGDVGLQVVDISIINELAGQTIHLPKQSRRKPPGLVMVYDVHHMSSVHHGHALGGRVPAYRLTVKDDLVYFVGWGALQIVDISDQLAPERVDPQSIEVGDYADLAVERNHAYLANGTDGVRIIDVSNPAAPVEVSAYKPEERYIRGLTVAGKYLYAAGSSESLRIVDVSDPLNPVEVSTYTVPLFAWDVEVRGDRAFVVWNLRGTGGGPSRECESGVSIVDVSTPETPVGVGQYCDPSRRGASDVAVVEHYMYVAAGEHGLRVLDISDPTAPREVGFYDTPGDVFSVTVDGDYIYVTDAYEGGLFILRFAPD